MSTLQWTCLKERYQYQIGGEFYTQTLVISPSKWVFFNVFLYALVLN